MTDKYKIVFQLIKASIWNNRITEDVDRAVYVIVKNHAIQALPADILSSLNIEKNLLHEWKTDILQTVSHNEQCSYIQSHLPISVPYVILKGTSAAQYYPHPQYRTLGDIDIITKREDYQTACEDLLKNGYKEITTQSELSEKRHRSFVIHKIIVEIHSFFGVFCDPKKAEYIDNLIIDNINSKHILPDMINGLVLLEHISQHMEEGLGLRQIIDWMLFVDKCLSDNNWSEFKKLAERIGLEQLALYVTRMCELYLGLPTKEWSKGVKEDFCKHLMQYVLSCGNFGKTRSQNISIGENVFYTFEKPRSFLKLLYERGKINLQICDKYPILKPVAGIYQMVRYTIRGIDRKDAIKSLKKEYESAKQRRKLFNALGIKQKAEGLAVYEDGKYHIQK